VSLQRTQSSVLVVEDQPWVARAIRRTLRAAGYRVEVALSCAVARALSGPFDLGAFDLDLPDGCGLVLARELLASRAVARVVFFTACTDSPRLDAVAQLGPVVRKSDGVAALMKALADLGL
jgi:DNA-binding response OmpR family regulator